MWNSVTINTLKLVPDQKSARTDSYASKFFNKLKIHAAPFISNSNNYLQSKNSSKMATLRDLIDISEPYMIPLDKSYDTSFSQRFSHKMPYTVPTSNKVPQIIGGFIGTKSHCSRKENDLNSLIMNLFNNKCFDEPESDIKSKVTPTLALVNGTSIAAEVEKYFSQRKVIESNEMKNDLNEESKSSICSMEATGKTQTTIASSTLDISKPICAVQPIIKLTESKREENPFHQSLCKSDEMEKYVEKTLTNKAPESVEISKQKNQYCSNCLATLQSDEKKSKSKKKGKINKQKAQSSIDKCYCTKDGDIVIESNEIKPKNVGNKCNTRKSRKSKQKRKMRLKQCREQQLITMMSCEIEAKTPSLLTSSEDKIYNCVKNWEDITSSEESLTAMVSNIHSECVDFEIDFDYSFETELCGVHSSPKSILENGRSDTSSISFILSGNDDSDCDSDVETQSDGEFDNDCWQSFHNPFSSSCLVFGSSKEAGCTQEVDDYDDAETRVEINFDNDGFEILISGNVSDDYDDYKPLSQNLKDINRRWNEVYKHCSYFKTKLPRVHFAPEEALIEVQIITLTCADERKSPWEQYSRDRYRFLDRITRTESIISPILCKDHRETVYNKRFVVKD